MKDKSFTLIELLVVISILSLLILIVFSGMRGTTDRARIAKVLQYQASLHRSLGADIIGWWQFDEGAGTTVKDISGYENNGEMHGNPQWVDGVPGTQGHALEFDGSGDYVKIDTNSSHDVIDSLTVSFWVKWGSSTKTHDLIVKDYQNRVFAIYMYTPDKLRFWVMSNGSWIGSEYDVDFSPEIGKWYYIVGTRDVTYQSLYIDTVEQYKTAHGHGDVDTDSDVTFGGGGYDYFNGLIDDVRIYSRALTAKEVQRIYAETKDKYLAKE